MVARLFSSLEGSSPEAAPKPAEAETTIVAAGVRVRRPDEFVLLVRPAAGLGAGLWSLPMAQMPEHATAEDTAVRLLRDGLRMDPGRLRFAETLTIDHDGFAVVVNVFDAIGWSGEPRYAARDYEDAAWVNPDALEGVDAVPEVSAWLSGAEPPTPDDVLPEKLAALLVEARTEVFAAYEAIASKDRERDLDSGWAPVDVLAHLASAEAYYIREACQLGDAAAHAWRPLNTEQWEADRVFRARPMDSEVVARLNQVQTETLKAVASMTQAQLAFYGGRASGGSMRAGEAVAHIAAHDREHIEQLKKMQGAARSAARR
jgi:ADP-ribose pyrophosphatase YjhB (NUDIX family)